MIENRFYFSLPEEAKAIREDVFIKEQGFQNEFDEHDKDSWFLVLYYNGYPVSTGRIYPENPETYHLGRVAVRKAFRGHLLGTYTVKFLCTKAKTLGGRIIILDAQADKIAFYKKLGFKDISNGEIQMDEGVPHIRMQKILYDPNKIKRRKQIAL